MTTQETDAELEKFIDKAVNDCCGSQECEGAPILYDWEDVDKVAKEVAAFAAKRAREKAIEECVAICEEKEKMSFLKYRPGARLCKLHFKKHLLGQSL